MDNKKIAAQILGRLGGSKNSAAQDAARARNGRLGGRPKKIKAISCNEIKVSVAPVKIV